MNEKKADSKHTFQQVSDTDRVEMLKKSIKELEHRAKYSKNPLEARQLRSRIGKLQMELKMLTS